MLAVLWWLPAAGVNVLKPYQAARLTGFTHPSEQRGTYNITQSMIAVGAAGSAAAASPARPRRASTTCPRTTTDFAFASLAEQRGFLGAAVLLLLYLLVVWRGLKIVARRP